MTIVGAVAARGQPRNHIVTHRATTLRHHRQHQYVLVVGFPGQPHDYVGGLHRNGLVGVVLAREAPLVLAVVEHSGVGHVVGAIDVGLDQEVVLGIADVLAQIGGHRRHRFEQRGKNTLPGADDWIGGVGDVKIGGAVVSVDHHFDRVADIVDSLGVALRVGKVIAGGVAVD